MMGFGLVVSVKMQGSDIKILPNHPLKTDNY